MTYIGRRAAAFSGTWPERLSALLTAIGAPRRRTFWGGVSACLCPCLSCEWPGGFYGSPDVSPLTVLGNAQLEKLRADTLRVVEQTGVVFAHERALDALAEAGLNDESQARAIAEYVQERSLA